jgi:hypothetical protein
MKQELRAEKYGSVFSKWLNLLLIQDFDLSRNEGFLKNISTVHRNT